MTMERIVLINPPNAKTVLRDMYSSTVSKGLYNWPNADLLVLSGVLSSEYEVVLIDANALRWQDGFTVKAVAELAPAGVCYAFGASVKEDEYLFLQALRAAVPDVPFIGTGGLLYHDAPAQLEAHPELGACLLNFTTDDVIRYFKGEYDGMHNVTYLRDGRVVTTPQRYPEHGFSYPVPAHAQLPLHTYRLSHGRSAPLSSVVTGYGCPYRCRYCVAGGIDYRYRDPDNVLEELRELKRLGVREVFFRDNTFCANRKAGYRLLKGMVDEQFGFSWVADTRANVVTDETAALMRRSGCHALHIGVESSNPGILETYAKGITLEQIRSAFAACRKHGIATVGYFILGLPGETPDDLENTLVLARELDCDYASFNMPIPIIGTELRSMCIENNWLRDEQGTYDGSSEPLINTDTLSASQIAAFRRRAVRSFYVRPGYLWKLLRRLRTPYQVKMAVLEFRNLLFR